MSASSRALSWLPPSAKVGRLTRNDDEDVAMAHGGLTEKEMTELIQRSAESNAALMRGDIDGYRALITLTDDFTLMSPFGGGGF
jgi:3'-phosphoadenosine 5'-phosphosulfate sulfotransferase